MSFDIHFDQLYVPGYDSERFALSALDDDLHSLIHGEFQIEANGRSLPHLGFFSPDDVCLNDWAKVLDDLRI